MDLDIRLLGAIEVHRSGTRLDLRGERQPTLLAYLALQPGSVRQLDDIIDALWTEDRLPADPRQAVHTYASRLRGVLGDDLVVARNGGYALTVDPLTVDVGRFEQLVRQARGPGCNGGRRLELLDKGLALWRGRALDGLHDAAWARADAVRLEELRAAVDEERAVALLEAGRPSEAIPELEAAASRNPLRERTHLLLMTALHRSGRQAEALRVYQRYRRRLGTDLGLEPGPDISATEHEIALSTRPPEAGVAPGQQARGYTLLERIGDGAFAVVYRGRQPSVDRDVAVKIIRAELANRPEFIRRFEAEANFVARLEHPNIVPLYDYWREPGSACLVMRLLRGGTLQDHIAGAPSISMRL